MKLHIVEFNWKLAGGSATIRLEGPAVKSALDQDQYFLVQTGFFTRHISELADHHPDQEVVLIPIYADRYLVVSFQPAESHNIPFDYPQPDPSSYRRVVASMLANIAANVQLDGLDVPLPLVTSR